MTSNSHRSGSIGGFSLLPSISSNSYHPSITDTLGSNDTNDSKSSRTYSCTVCHCDFSNPRHFHSHLNSRQHQQAQSIFDVLQSVDPEYRAAYKAVFSPDMLNKKVFNRELRCEDEIKKISEPLLGLNYIIEFQFENLSDPVQYVCDLCHCKCSSFRAIISHILNIQHQRKFLKTHHPDMYERVVAASAMRTEQQLLIRNYAKQIQSRHAVASQIRLHLQFNSLVGQKPLVLAVTFRSGSTHSTQTSTPLSIQLTSKTFEEYNYPYENELIPSESEEIIPPPVKSKREDTSQWGLSPEDILYPFDRQFWHENYKDLLQSRPIDPHSVTYEEATPETKSLQPFSHSRDNKTNVNTMSPLQIIANENQLTLENGQTIRRNPSQSSNRRVILDTSRTSTINKNGILTVTATTSESPSDFDDFDSFDEQSKTTNGNSAILNERSARAILAANGLLKSDEEEEMEINRSRSSSMNKTNSPRINLEQTVSPALAKRMLEAVLAGDLDVVHIQPYFATFVNLIQSGQVELERHQAERLLHKVLVTSSTSSKVKIETIPTNYKRTRSRSRSREPRPSNHQHHHSREVYHSSSNSHRERSSSAIRRVHLINERPSNHGR